MEWNQMKKMMGLDPYEAELDLPSRRADAAHWAYETLRKAFASVDEEVETTPAALADRDRRKAAVTDMIHAVGIDLADDGQRDVIAILSLLQQQICRTHDEALEFTLTLCELVLDNEPGMGADTPTSQR